MKMGRLLSFVARLAGGLVPPPRRTPTLLAAWPLALFLLLTAAGLVAVVQAQLLRFASPWAFAWLAATPWIWWLHAAGWGGLHGARAVLALFIRLLLITTLALALAEPRAVRTSDDLCLVYCLDASDSIGDGAGGQARQWMLESVGGKPKQDQAGLVIFGRDAAVELPPSQSFPFQTFTTRVAHDGTDIEKALMLSAAVLPEDRPGRIVLISDGVATQGNVERALDELVRRGIAVDVLPIQYDHTQEVWVEKLDLPRQVRPGETYEAGVVLGSLQDGHGDLVLRENGKEIARQAVQYRSGKTRFTLPLYLRGPGYYEYVATIEPAAGYDSLSENNSAMGYLYLQGEGRILVLTDPDGDPADSTALVQALTKTNRLIEVKSAYDCPNDELALLPYDSVILVNAPADAFNAPQQQALHDGVYNLGVGLLMIGGKNSYGPGGWNRTPVEDALPVSMDITQRKVMPKGALAIILHTCEFGDGNTWAKRITKQAIRVLGARDEIGAIDYDSGGRDQWIFPLTPAGKYDQLEPLIESASPADMPSFVSTMTMAYQGLMASDAATKHLIIISDGDPSPPPPNLLGDYIKAKISVSVVSVFPHGNTEVAAFRAIAEATGGRAYFPQDASRLPAIFIKEAKTLKRSQIQNVTFTPKTAFPSAILKGITEAPPLHGYVLTTIKSRAQTILTGPQTDEDNPLLASWRFGVGSAAAFTSDLAPNWAVDWVQWERYQAFVEQLLKAIGRGESHSDLSLVAEADGERGVITVEDHHADPGFLTVQATIIKPGGGSASIDLRQIGPGRYQGAFPLAGKGRYQIMAAGSSPANQGGSQRLDRVVGGFIVAYSAEYLRFRADPMVLAHIAERTGGRQLSGSEKGKELFGVVHQPRSSSKPIFDAILVILACLLPLDVAMRRVQFDPGALFARLRRTRTPASSPTMGALLSAKQRAVAPRAPHAAPSGSPLTGPPLPGSAAARPTGKPAGGTSAPPTPPAAPPASGGSMASRLLEAKRKRQSNDDPKPRTPHPPVSFTVIPHPLRPAPRNRHDRHPGLRTRDPALQGRAGGRPRRGRQGHRRPGPCRRRGPDRAAVRRACPARRRARAGQDRTGQDPRTCARSRFPPHPVHPGPDAGRYRRHHHDERQRRRLPSGVPPRAGLHPAAARR